MSTSSASTNNSHALRVYRIPVNQKRNYRYNDERISVPYVQSPSSDEKIIVARRRQPSPQTSTVRIVEMNSPRDRRFVKQYYPTRKTTRIIREQSPLSTSSDDSTSSQPITIIKRRDSERIVRLPTTSTVTTSNTDVIVPITRKKPRRAIVETPVAIVSETPLVNRGTSPRKQWKRKDKTVPLDLDRDVYVSDDDYYEEAFPDGSYKPKSYKFCKCCHGKCARRCPQCNFCEWYYSCPCCCWLTCLLLSLGFLIGIFVLLGLLPETNPSRRPVITKEVNTTINAIQQNLPCDPITTYNASSTLIRCIDTTPVYIYTVVAQSYSHACQLHAFTSFYLFIFLNKIFSFYS